MSLYLSRLRLNRNASAAALLPLLNPPEQEKAADAHHRLMWLVFADGPERTRDFLWRYDDNGQFMTLSTRPPQPHDLFQTPETKEFSPNLHSGDRLEFLLRANATRARKDEQDQWKRVDLVMDRLHKISQAERATQRPAIAQEAAQEWLTGLGERSGFTPNDVIAENYNTLELGRKRRQGATFGILDLRGQLTVTDPALFLPALTKGFGRAKAWGCGLMLIRRALHRA
ncbi:MAG: type I-E CRISPR-associated protein Cas6/Cse3/CasE [Cellvibrionales bacterium]|nr:type I-E CRISPR-associated protein Cas6/Cse3/CasE [Cellvibrionales bacterium]